MNLANVCTEAEKFCTVSYPMGRDNIHFTMPNGVVVSVGYGTHHYCSARVIGRLFVSDTTDVEIYSWKPNGKIYVSRKFGFQGDGIKGWVPCDELLDILKHVRRTVRA